MPTRPSLVGIGAVSVNPADPPEVSWTPALIPDLTGSTAVVTGANSGIGYVTALELVRHGCHVVLACRDAGRAAPALERLQAQTSGSAEVRRLDLADLASVREFAAGLTGETSARLDLLVNNAGVMATPPRTSADGFELQLATNHLGPFALTGSLLPLLLRGTFVGGLARVVTVSSLVSHVGRLNRADLMLHTGYTPYRAYSQSKLANLLFMTELQRRADAAAAPVASLASHPGFAATRLMSVGPAMTGNRLMARVMEVVTRLFAQPAEHGAWPSLRAGTDPSAQGGEFYGPGRFGGARGRPVRIAPAARAVNPEDAAWLWERSVELTGVDYAELTPR